MNPENSSTAIDAKTCLTALDTITHAKLGDTLLAIMGLSKEAIDNLTLLFHDLHTDASETILDNLFSDDVVTNCGLDLPGYRPNPAGGTLLVLASLDPDITPSERRDYVKRSMFSHAVTRIIFDIPEESMADYKPVYVLSADLVHEKLVARQWLQADLSSEFRDSVRALQCAVREYMQVPVPPHLRPAPPP